MARASSLFTMIDPLRRLARLGYELATAVATLAAPGQAAGQTTPSIDCQAVNRGALNVELFAEASATRIVALRSGETVTFTLRGGSYGTLTLLEEGGSRRVLLAGPTGTRASFAAGGLSRLQFAKQGEATGSFTASCLPSPGPGDGSPASGPIGDGSVAAEALTDPAIAAALDPNAPRLLQESKGPTGGGTAIAPPKSVVGPEMKLQWREERYAGIGPEGLLTDGNASGVELGVNYKLQSAITIGALAQFNPAGEVLFGGQRSLSDVGWMAGPVTTVQFAPGLLLDARAAWGLADADPYDVTGAGAQRRLLSAKLANPQLFGAWRFTPSINFSHVWEMLHTPAAAPAEIPTPHALGFGRIDIGPELAYRVDVAPKAFIEPRAALGGFWGFDNLTKLAPAGHPDLRFKAEAGVTIGIVDGPKLQALGGVEEGAAGLPDAWSGRLQLSLPLK